MKISTRKAAYITLSLVVVGAVIFAGGRSEWFKGALPDIDPSLDPGAPVTYDTVANAEEAKDAAYEARNDANVYAVETITNAENSETAYLNNDSESLIKEQSAASSNATATEAAYDAAKHYKDEAIYYYDLWEALFNEVKAVDEALARAEAEYNENRVTPTEQLEAAQAEYDAAYAWYVNCVMNPKTCLLEAAEATLNEAEAVLNSSQEYYDAWQAALDEYNAYHEGTYIDAKTARDDAKADADSAQIYASEALNFAKAAAQAEIEALSYKFLSCAELTIDPLDYEMAALATEASFALTASARGDGEAEFSKWIGTLKFESSGDGVFTQGIGRSSNPLETTTDSADSVNLDYSAGIKGETITVSVIGEESLCSKSFTITQLALNSIPITPLPGSAEVVITETDGSSAVTEGDSSTDTYTAVLTSEPLNNVTLTMSASGQVSLTPSTISFTATNWSVPQTVEITAIDDFDIEGTHTETITHSVASDDTVYDGLAVDSVVITIEDNDSSIMPPAPTVSEVVITETDGSSAVTEGDASVDTYTAVLTSEPSTNVTLTMSTGGQVSLTPSTISFTNTNWSLPQTVEITAIDDTDIEGAHTETISHSVTSSDLGYNGISVQSVLVTIEDNDSTEPPVLNDPVVEEPDEDDISYNVPESIADIILSNDYICVDSFVDTKGEWHEDIICRMKEAGWVQGYAETVFGPNGDITRAEWVKVLTKVFGYNEDDADGLSTEFLDISTKDWYYEYVLIAEDLDVIRTRDSGEYFNPNEPITRGDAILYAIRMADQSTYTYDVEDIFSDVENDDYFAYAVFIAYETLVDTAEEDDVRVIEGYSDGSFDPYDNIARSEAMAIATRVAIAWGVASEDWDE